MRILHIDTSILGEYSASRVLSAAVMKNLTAANPDAEVSYLDLAENPLDHLSGAHIAVQQGLPVDQVPHIADDLARSSEALETFMAADVVVIGVAMYNFTVPSQLKAWIDRILMAGKTFRYTETGAEGFMGGKRVILCIARGSVYSNGAPAAPLEFAESYLKGIFGFIGIFDVETVIAEGLAISPEHRETAVGGALEAAGALPA